MNRRGFTIIELIIIISIAAILLTLSVANLRGSQANARDTERKTDIETIAQHLENYYTSGSEDGNVIGNYPTTALVGDLPNIKEFLRDIDEKSLTAPGESSLSLIAATNDEQTTTSVTPQPKINEYVYQPINASNVRCTAESSSIAQVLVVAGGGGGGYFGGGGGGGGLIHKPSLELSSPSSHTVIVGNGGVGSNTVSVNGTNGADSYFGSERAYGGGGGGSRQEPSYIGKNGNSGGSGGGASPSDNTTLPVGGSASPAGQGYSGGSETSYGWGGSGGGGATSIGKSGVWNNGGNGGAGLLNPIPVQGIYYLAGGGGGGTYRNGSGIVGSGGSGVGGAGGKNSNGYDGNTNTGGGGGGSDVGSFKGGNGGSGIVIVRYQTGSITATGGALTYVGPYTIHTFTTVGTSNFTVTDNVPICTKFNLYYRSEVDNNVYMIKSKNR